MYLSTSSQTLAGEGNFYPRNFFAQLLSSLQYLLGVFYSTAAIAVVLHRWDTAGYSSKPKMGTRWQRFKHHVWTRKIRTFIREWLGPITMLVQATKLVLLYYLEKDHFGVKSNSFVLAWLVR